jgi:predicted LPLAT superfamily acyltransferase
VLLEHDANVDAEDKKGRTPLHLAAGMGKNEAVLVLLGNNANSVEGRTPHLATGGGDVEVVRVLLEHSANVAAEDKKGRTPLQLAAREGNVEVVCELLEHGANVGAEDNRGRTPLQVAVSEGKVEVVRVLLKHVGEEEDGLIRMALANRDAKKGPGGMCNIM